MPYRIGELCIMAIAVVAVGNAHLLTQGELLRASAIATGLGIYYWFCVRRSSYEPGGRSLSGVSILGLISVYFLVQFDPAFSGISRSSQRNFVNWYSVVTATLSLVAFASVILNGRRSRSDAIVPLGSRLSRWDWSVLATCAIALLLLLGVAFFGTEVSAVPVGFTSAKLSVSAMLYAAVIGTYRSTTRPAPGSQDTDHGRRTDASIWKLLAVVFLSVLLVGTGKTVYARMELKEGKDLVAQGRHADAVESLESALMLWGMHSEECQIALAEAYLGSGDIEAAKEQIASARRLYLGSQTLEKRIGDAFSSTGHWERAFQTYLSERRKRRDPLYVFDELSRAYLGAGRYRELTDLIERQNKAPAVNLDSVDDRVRLAICLTEAGRYVDARRELDTAIVSSSDNWLVEYGKGVLANRTRDWEKGAKALRRSIELESTKTEPRLELGAVLLELGEFEAAGEQAMLVLEREPDRILALGQLASVYAQRKEMDRVADQVGRMTVRVSASQWQGPQRGHLGATGSCWYDMELYPGDLSLSIQASGTQASGEWPVMVVSLDREEIASVTVDRADTYKFETRVKRAGSYRLSVAFINDSTSSQKEDRNLKVGRALIQYLRIN